MTKRSRWIPILALGLSVGVLATCSDDEPTEPGAIPETHTIELNAVRHAPGLCAPLDECAECHGIDLRGGVAGKPSCFQCHDDEWNTAARCTNAS